MKYFILIWAGIWRKKMRTIFTMLSVVIAFLLFGLLQGFNLGLENVIGNLNANRLYTNNKYSMVEGLPVALQNQIATVDGVTHITHWTFFGAFYQEAKNAVPLFATNISEMFALYPELGVDPEVLEAMERTRNGMVVGKPVANRYGWQVGDVIPIGTSIWTNKQGSNNYQFELIHIVDPTSSTGTNIEQMAFINFEFFDEARAFGNGTVHYFITGIDDPRRGGEIATNIDKLFTNSTNETHTQTEQAMAASSIKQVGDIGFIVNAIVGAVLFTLLFLTANTMMQSMRERIPELAILKTLGFSDTKVSVFVLCESMLLCVVSALIGLAVASYLFTFLKAVFGPISIPWEVLAMGTIAALGLALISGLPPAIRTQRLNIIDALAGR